MKVQVSNFPNFIFLTFIYLLLTVVIFSCNSDNTIAEQEKEIFTKIEQPKPPLIFEDLSIISRSDDDDDDDDEDNDETVDGEVEGEEIPLTFFGLNEFDTYEVEVEDGEVEGTFFVEVLDPETEEVLQDFEGDITCVTFEEDGRTARLGAIVTGSNTFPEFIGTFAVWTVVDNGDDENDQTTDLRVGVPEFVRDFHCETGFPIEAFGGTFQTTTGDIEVESDIDDDDDDDD